MEPSGLSVFKQLNARMRWLTERQTVISQNIANVDTPGYNARELKAPSFAKTMALAQPKGDAATPKPTHIAVMPETQPGRTGQVEEAQEISISGNSVDLEHELKKSADTAMEYQTMTHLYRKHMEMLRMAIQSDRS